MPRGASRKREREYEELKERFEEEGRYPGRDRTHPFLPCPCRFADFRPGMC
jgi:hypothetical protein